MEGTEKISEKMVFVEGGTFSRGGEIYDNSGTLHKYALPVHKVTLDNFFINKTVVTQGEWKKIMNYNPSGHPKKISWSQRVLFKQKQVEGVSESFPVDRISWYEALMFCNKLSIIEGLIPVYSGLISNFLGERPVFYAPETGITINPKANGYRLPTEAEWEYAARGGNKSNNFMYSGGNELAEVAWYARNSDLSTHPVSLKKPNELGLYDMSGNVFEWCWDWNAEYVGSEQKNPAGSLTGTKRVVRGCCYLMSEPQYFYSIHRHGLEPEMNYNISVGLRIARSEGTQFEFLI